MVPIGSQLKYPVRLITIPLSHYCEKIRWALTRLQIPFVEERHMPPFHRFATRQQVGRQTESPSQSNMSSINRFISRLVGGQSVPVLIAGATTIADSKLSDLPVQMVANIQSFRETLAGKFVLNLYEEYGYKG